MNSGSISTSNETLQDENSLAQPASTPTTHSLPTTNTPLPSQIKNNLLGQNLGNKAPENEQLHQIKQLISPLGLIQTASEQILGKTTPEEQQRIQSEIAQSQQKMAEEKQQLEAFRQKQSMQRQKQGQTNAMLAEQASSFTNKPVTHVGSSQTEQTLLEKIIADGQAKASQPSGTMMPNSPQKGPNMGNNQPKTNMMAAMQPDKQKPKKSEPAAHELPLGE